MLWVRLVLIIGDGQVRPTEQTSVHQAARGCNQPTFMRFAANTVLVHIN
jgi:hypothetical protein